MRHSLREGAARTDGVVHLAFNHDFSQFQKNCEDGCGGEQCRARTFLFFR
jgi:hypothetical protein